MRINTKPESIYTHGGAKAAHINHELQLRRSVMSCLLWENAFYEDGVSIADRIAGLIPKVASAKVGDIVLEARNKMYLRHIPLFMISIMANIPGFKPMIKDLLYQVIQRPDELTEFLAIYWKDGKCPISAQIKKGLAAAFTKFNEYSLAKYNQDNKYKLRDVLFLCHTKPKDSYEKYTKIERRLEKEGKRAKHELKPHELLYKNLINNQLQVPDTWEVSLSAKTQETKKDKWERLLAENKLGGLALLRNLRNMADEKVNENLVIKALKENLFNKVLPFRFIAAAKYVPQWELYLEEAMIRCLIDSEKLLGKTVLILDVSGSMRQNLAAKSEMNRIGVAAALAMILREKCEKISIYATAGDDFARIHATRLLPARHGFALKDAFNQAYNELGGGGIFLKQVMDYTYEKETTADRTIVLTDEQDCDNKCNPATAITYGKYNYLINVSSEKNGIGYGKWIHIDGWSEAVINFIQQYEGIKFQ